MRMFALAMAAAAAVLAFPASGFPQDVEIGPGGIRVDPDSQGASQEECEELRRACLHKEELGEEGEGNCRRYRETCKED
jgi:hypothetical protein